MNAETEKFVMPAVSLKEQPASYTFTFTLPGIGKKDADLHVEGRTLTLNTPRGRTPPGSVRSRPSSAARTTPRRLICRRWRTSPRSRPRSRTVSSP